MILMAYAIVGFAALLMILLSKSHKAMNGLSVMHSLAYLLLTIYAIIYAELPAYYSADKYLFVDHFGLYEVLIASLLFLLASVYSRGYVEGLMNIGELDRANLKLFYVAFNLLLIAVSYSFFSNNLALFWIFAELTTVFSAVLIVTLKAKKNIGAALKYVFIASTSMLFSFIGLIFIFTMTAHTLGAGTLNWDALMVNATALSPSILLTSFVFMLIGFAAKSGLVPFHAWLPTAYSKAPSAISALLSGSVSSVGIYGILRVYAIASQTSAAPKISLLLIIFGLLSIATAAFSMLSQINLKKLIAFSSIENAGLMLVGIGIGTPVAVFWVLFHLLAHALAKSLLFFSGGIIHRQYGSMHAEEIKDALKVQPLASAGLIIGAAAIIGMPPFAIFISKLYLLLQAGSVSTPLLLALLLLLFVAAAGFAVFLARMFSQSDDEGNRPKTGYAAPTGMKASIIALAVLMLLLGVFMPQHLSGLLDSIVKELGFL